MNFSVVITELFYYEFSLFRNYKTFDLHRSLLYPKIFGNYYLVLCIGITFIHDSWNIQ